MAQKCRGWCFTINNDKFKDLEFIIANFDYCIFGFETGEQGTSHIQGYMYFNNAVYFNTIKKLLPRAHIEAAKGTPQQNYEYCSKEGDFYEFGTRPEQGTRSDLNEIRKKLINKVSLGQIASDHFGSFIRYHKGFEKFKQVYSSLNKNNTNIQVKFITIEEYNILLKSNEDKYFFACEESDLIGFNDEEYLVIVNYRKFNTYKLQLLENNRGYQVKYGYDTKIIKPKSVYIVKDQLLEQK